MNSSPLWAITSYFNPAGYRSRRHNYRIFRRHLVVPLVTVELSYSSEFELSAYDAEILVQLKAHDVLWQKERLLNVALENLPKSCKYVAWLDSDVIFEHSDWPGMAVQSLQNCSLVQLFSERCNLRRHRNIDSATQSDFQSRVVSTGRKHVSGTLLREDLTDSNAPLSRGCTAGLAWATWREIIEKSKLYDACITGSGDRAILCAALGRFNCGTQASTMTGRRIDHYLDWAEPFHERIRGSIGFVEGRIFHLFHGDLRERQYQGRHQILTQHQFDPYTDLRIDERGCWCWASGKTAMHDRIRQYFFSRKEDRGFRKFSLSTDSRALA